MHTKLQCLKIVELKILILIFFFKFAIFKHCEQNNFKVQYTNVIEVFI